jgi:anthranilate synthase component 1
MNADGFAGKFNHIPLFAELHADLETPVSTFLKVRDVPRTRPQRRWCARAAAQIRDGNYSFLFESVEGGERQARYSILGTKPFRVVQTGVCVW